MSCKKWNEDWYFWKVTDSFAMGGGIPGNAEIVNLPHDAMLFENARPDSPNGGNTGWHDGGVYKYAKKLYVSAEEKGKILTLKFEGVYMNALIYVNGQLAAKNIFGYSNIFADLTPFLKYDGENLICVEARAGAMKNSRWYSGAGIYRDVYLMEQETARILPEGIWTETLEIRDHNAYVKLNTEVENQARNTRELRISYQLLDEKKNIAAAGSTLFSLFGGEKRLLERTFPVENPALWSAENPALYQCVVTLSEKAEGEEAVLDTSEREIGIRTLTVDAKRGLCVNGETVKLRGACVHHDSGLLGAATYDAAEYRRAYKLKDAGFNAIRMAHQPIAPAFLRACDHLGLYVMDEAFDMWNSSKSDYDYALSFAENWKADITAMVKKDRPHPSVVMYSIGNEIGEIGTDMGTHTCYEISSLVHSLDKTRFVTAGLNGVFVAGDKLDELTSQILANSGSKPSGNVNDYMTVMDHHMEELVTNPIITGQLEKICSSLDIAGYNYMTARYELDKQLYQDRVIVGSETYPPQIHTNWTTIKKCPNVIGDFTWTGWDYIGEAGLGIPAYHIGEGAFVAFYPVQLAGTGDIDITGYRRPMSYLRELVFEQTRTPYISVQKVDKHGQPIIMQTPWFKSDDLSCWNWPGMEGKPAVVEVFSAGDEAELFQNGRSLGRKPAGEANAYRCLYETTYEPGRLTAVSYEKGREIGRYTLKTADPSAALKVTAEDMKEYGCGSLPAEEQIYYLKVEISDASGVLDASAKEVLTVETEGKIAWIRCGSADPASLHNPLESLLETYQGRGQIIVAKQQPEEAVKVTVKRGEESVSIIL